jgi:hypothetical protein
MSAIDCESLSQRHRSRGDQQRPSHRIASVMSVYFPVDGIELPLAHPRDLLRRRSAAEVAGEVHFRFGPMRLFEGEPADGDRTSRIEFAWLPVHANGTKHAPDVGHLSQAVMAEARVAGRALVIRQRRDRVQVECGTVGHVQDDEEE